MTMPKIRASQAEPSTRCLELTVPSVETFTPPGTPTPIGPYNHIAKVGPFITIGGTAGFDPATGALAADVGAMNAAYVEMMGTHRPARTVIGVAELPKPGVLLTMNLTAVTRDA